MSDKFVKKLKATREGPYSLPVRGLIAEAWAYGDRGRMDVYVEVRAETTGLYRVIVSMSPAHVRRLLGHGGKNRP